MQKIRVELPHDGYDIVVGSRALAELPGLLPSSVKPSRIMIVSNPVVEKHYGAALREILAYARCDVVTELIPEGETHKNLKTVEHLLDRMVEARLERTSLLISLGGGVVGDIAGLAAALYMRGIPYLQIPTTLLAQVDSSIGGKVGVDHSRAKNMIGAFYQPILVCVDPALLSTLPDAQMRNGMAEVIKYGVIADEELFALLEQNSNSFPSLNGDLLEEVIRCCCRIKARIVQQDVRETTGLRVILNYGHTIGHAIESATGYGRFLHGEAIALGMAASAKIARLMKISSEDVERRQERLLSVAGLPNRLEEIEIGEVLEATRLDKKVAGGKARFVLPLAIGKVTVRDDIPEDVIEAALSELAAH